MDDASTLPQLFATACERVGSGLLAVASRHVTRHSSAGRTAGADRVAAHGRWGPHREQTIL